MSNALFFTLLFLIALLIFLLKDGGQYFFEIMKICHESSRKQCPCACSQGVSSSDAVSSYNEKESSANREFSRFAVRTPSPEYKCCESERMLFLDKMGYFLASNDEKNSPRYNPTSLQDTEPKDFA
jgi:hypothetical protein